MDRLKAQRDAKKADESDEPADGLVTGRLGGGAQVMPRSTPVWDEASTPGYKPGTPLTKEARGEPGRVLHSAALLRMPPSAMAGRPTGAYLRVFVELEHAASDQNLPPVTRTRAV